MKMRAYLGGRDSGFRIVNSRKRVLGSKRGSEEEGIVGHVRRWRQPCRQWGLWKGCKQGTDKTAEAELRGTPWKQRNDVGGYSEI